jgi:alkanesulfonate monooxygenase SsuD/methylene tetrahydromethanopterin reductase-like flavin-dependent oxidoreductase (luciferase family)
MNFGITLSNRGVLVGLCSPRDLLALADAVEACAAMDSVWCGDALFVNRRLDALTLLAAVAGRTQRVLLGPACMGSFALRNPLVFAYEWASLDVLSNGRTRLVACAGGGAGPLWEAESAALGVAPGERRKRMIENIHVLRHLWTKDDAPFTGQFTTFSKSSSNRSRCSRRVRSGWRPMPNGWRKARPIPADRRLRSPAWASSPTAG